MNNNQQPSTETSVRNYSTLIEYAGEMEGFNAERKLAKTFVNTPEKEPPVLSSVIRHYGKQKL